MRSWGRGLVVGLVSLWEEEESLMLTASPLRGHRESSHQELNHPEPWSGTSTSRTMRKHTSVVKPLHLWYFAMTAWADSDPTADRKRGSPWVLAVAFIMPRAVLWGLRRDWRTSLALQIPWEPANAKLCDLVLGRRCTESVLSALHPLGSTRALL